MRFPIRFEPSFRVFSKLLFLSPDDAHVDVADDLVQARFAWSFRATFPRSAVTSTSRYQHKTLSRGVHGFAGRWLVNGSGDRILAIHLAPSQRGYVMGFPVVLNELLVSVDDPDALASALQKH